MRSTHQWSRRLSNPSDSFVFLIRHSSSLFQRRFDKYVHELHVPVMFQNQTTVVQLVVAYTCSCTHVLINYGINDGCLGHYIVQGHFIMIHTSITQDMLLLYIDTLKYQQWIIELMPVPSLRASSMMQYMCIEYM